MQFAQLFRGKRPAPDHYSLNDHSPNHHSLVTVEGQGELPRTPIPTHTTVPNGLLIELKGVIKSYATPVGEFRALKGIDLQIAAGEFVAVIGKSGSGKSTLSNMITGIDRPTSGEVLVAGTRVDKLSEGQIATWRGRTIGVVFQFFQLLPALTVVENIMLPMDFTKIFSDRERRVRALELLEQVDMAPQANKLPTALSGGQQQRVAIARALANDPPIIVADEPTGNLDSRTAEAVFELFQRLVAGGKSILMVTHDDDLSQRVTRAVTIADGQIASDKRTSDKQIIAAGRPTLGEPLMLSPNDSVTHNALPQGTLYA